MAQKVKILDLINNTGAEIYAQMTVAIIHKPLPIYSLKSAEWRGVHLIKDLTWQTKYICVAFGNILLTRHKLPKVMLTEGL